MLLVAQATTASVSKLPFLIMIGNMLLPGYWYSWFGKVEVLDSCFESRAGVDQAVNSLSIRPFSDDPVSKSKVHLDQIWVWVLGSGQLMTNEAVPWAPIKTLDACAVATPITKEWWKQILEPVTRVFVVPHWFPKSSPSYRIITGS